MPKNTKICRVCGATYEACNTVRTGSKVFNWREVACSPECGAKYLEKVVASRQAKPVIEEPVVMRFPCKKKTEVSEVIPEVVLEDECVVEDTDAADLEEAEVTE